MPHGRFYATGDNRFWRGYERADDAEAHADVRAAFDEILAAFPPLTADHPYFETEKGREFLEAYRSETERRKHLHNHRDYQFNDETE
jgi:hypothetical protein